MKYKVLKQDQFDERVFELEDESGNRFNVDIYTDGAFEHPEGADKNNESWRKWLGTFVGKTLEIERIYPYRYFTRGRQKIVKEEK